MWWEVGSSQRDHIQSAFSRHLPEQSELRLDYKSQRRQTRAFVIQEFLVGGHVEWQMPI